MRDNIPSAPLIPCAMIINLLKIFESVWLEMDSRQASTLKTVESLLGAIDLWGQDVSQWAGLAEAISDQLTDMERESL